MTALFDRAVGHILYLLVAAAALLTVAGAAQSAEGKPLRGVALVVGNGAYQHLPKLANPANDADAVEALLSDLGFDSVRRADRNGAALKRDLDRFIEDAADADVAILYYSGHGIEAGGENFLIPVDADLAALDAAGEALVPLSAYIEQLKASVPVAIVMLDACRDNPFPEGAVVRLAPDAPAAPIGAAGLAETRGAASLMPAEATGDQSLGTVIAFAAEPGKTALDGEPGAGSPYAAAVTRHLDAMAGEEFGTVMRMVAEEVYLKTAGRQRPWMNESLRRLLYFGKAGDAPVGEEGDILKERRQLLITISALPDFDRKQVEAAASEAAVPMDALYGMLRTLGADMPKDPAELDKLLRSQADRLKELLTERAALKSTDAEIVRLSSLADKAVAEGALQAALSLHERAKARVGELEKTVDTAEADVKARRIEFAEVYARSAEAYALNFQHLQAAEDYARAFDQVERWDDDLAWYYKVTEAQMLAARGDFGGDNAALQRSLDIAVELGGFARRLNDPAKLASAELNRGIALMLSGDHEPGVARLEEAAAAFRRSLDLSPRATAPFMWAAAQTNLASVLGSIAERQPSRERLVEAIEANRAAIAQFAESRQRGWIPAQFNLGRLLYQMAEREPGLDLLQQSAAAFQLVKVDPQADPAYWAMAKSGLAITMQMIGLRTEGTGAFQTAVSLNREALAAMPRERSPMYWATTQRNLGNALAALGDRRSSAADLREAIAALRAALEEFSRERTLDQWTGTTGNLAQALGTLGALERNVAVLEDAVSIGRDLLANIDRKASPILWARQANNTANDATLITQLGGPVSYIEWAATVLPDAIGIQDAYQDRPAVAFTRLTQCDTLVELGKVRKDKALVAEGIRQCELGRKMKWEYGMVEGDDQLRKLTDARAELRKLGG